MPHFYCNAKFGDDVVTINENENLELKFYSANHYQIGYEIDDSDILITVYGYENYSVNRNVVMGTVRVLNGANQTAYGETGTFALYSTTGYDYDTSKRNFLT